MHTSSDTFGFDINFPFNLLSTGPCWLYAQMVGLVFLLSSGISRVGYAKYSCSCPGHSNSYIFLSSYTCDPRVLQAQSAIWWSKQCLPAWHTISSSPVNSAVSVRKKFAWQKSIRGSYTFQYDPVPFLGKSKIRTKYHHRLMARLCSVWIHLNLQTGSCYSYTIYYKPAPFCKTALLSWKDTKYLLICKSHCRICQLLADTFNQSLSPQWKLCLLTGETEHGNTCITGQLPFPQFANLKLKGYKMQIKNSKLKRL